MRRFLLLLLLLTLITTALWGCTPIRRTILTQSPSEIQTSIQQVLSPWSIASEVRQTNDASQAILSTELIKLNLALPAISRAGACMAPSVNVPRTNAWQCQVDNQLYDPCFALDEAHVIVCAARSAGAEEPFRVDLTEPLLTTTPSPEEAALELEALRNIKYQGLFNTGSSIKLVAGRFTGSVNDAAQSTAATEINIQLGEMQTRGDLDADGDSDTAVILMAETGDDELTIYLAAVTNQAGQAVNSATVALGTRTRIDKLAIEGGQIVVDLLMHSAQDPFCCPSLATTRYFNLVGDQLVPYVNGWQVELDSQVFCNLQSEATALVANERLNYRCSDGTWLLGDLQPGQVWSVQRAILADPATFAIQTIDTVPVRRVWQ